MKAEKLRELDTAELRRQLAESEQQLFRLRFQLGMGQTDQLKRFRELRKDRARMLTIVRERELAQAAASVSAGRRQPRHRQPRQES